eukprot:2460415-Prymnesium_polylepis.1
MQRLRSSESELVSKPPQHVPPRHRYMVCSSQGIWPVCGTRREFKAGAAKPMSSLMKATMDLTAYSRTSSESISSAR